MSVVPLRRPTRVEELEAEVEMLKAQLVAIGLCHAFDRFHAFDAIKDDSCPSCGGRVEVRHEGNAVMLHAVETSAGRLRVGIEEALGYLRQDRKTLATDALKAALTGQTW